MKVKRTAAAALAVFLLSGFVAAEARAVPAQAERKLVILFTNDLHSIVLPRVFLGEDGKRIERGGFARLASLIRRERDAAAGGTLVLDAGDFSMGTLFHTLFMTEAAELRLLGLMGFEASTLGNHEFDFGLDGLARCLQAAKAKGKDLPALVASNIGIEGAGPEAEAGRTAFRDYPVRDYIVLERGGLRVGIFGLFGTSAADDSPFAGPVKFLDAAAEARRVVEILRTKEKADLIIALSHVGTSDDPSDSEDEKLALAEPGIDILISAHTHTVMKVPRFAGRTIIVSAGWGGEYLGRLEAAVGGREGAKVVSYALLPVGPDVPEDPAVAAAAAGFKAMIEKDYLTDFPGGFGQVLAESAFDLESPEAMEASGVEAGMGDFLADALREAVRKAEGSSSPHIHAVIVPVGVVRGAFLAGPITVEDVFRVFSLGLGPDRQPGYPLLSLWLKGKELRHLVEVQASVVPMKSDAALQFSGLRFHYNPHRLAFDRVTDVSVLEPDGSYAPLDSGKLYRIVVDSYAGAMVDYVSKASYGLLKMQARDAEGRPLQDQLRAAVDADPAAPGLQELKGWKALAGVLKDLPDLDGDAIPDIPARYRKPEGRFGPVPSWSPLRILIGGGGLTYIVLAFLTLIVVLAVWIVRRLRRRRRARRVARRTS
ncbi:MAG: bifunctional UDP-sugar hydrolase/5'-nucleotidase [Candidatus Aminicenantes bacterium]|nr:bifunctional UDP-sugar hydrolase/5'-nucleotidase [Candidatus Aminicenantes bacterium]